MSDALIDALYMHLYLRMSLYPIQALPDEKPIGLFYEQAKEQLSAVDLRKRIPRPIPDQQVLFFHQNKLPACSVK